MSLSGLISYSIREATDQLARLLANMQQASVAVSAEPDKYFRLINHYRSEQNARVKSCTKPKAQKKKRNKKMAQISIYPKITKETQKVPPSFVLGAVTVGAGQSINLVAVPITPVTRHVTSRTPADNGHWTTDNELRTPKTGQIRAAVGRHQNCVTKIESNQLKSNDASSGFWSFGAIAAAPINLASACGQFWAHISYFRRFSWG